MGDSIVEIDILKADAWFELREIRNQISHEYDDKGSSGSAILNGIFDHKAQLRQILEALLRFLDR